MLAALKLALTTLAYASIDEGFEPVPSGGQSAGRWNEPTGGGGLT